MKMIVTFLAFALMSFMGGSKVNYKIKASDAFVITQKMHYKNPDYNDKSTKYDNVNLGPLLEATYIDDADIKTIGDLKKFYPINENAGGDRYWDRTISLKNAKYALAVFKNGDKMPVIVTNNKMVFSFVIEEGMLAFDIKTVDVLETGNGAVYGTVEIGKLEKK
jgi:hypothetical protein